MDEDDNNEEMWAQHFAWRVDVRAKSTVFIALSIVSVVGGFWWGNLGSTRYPWAWLAVLVLVSAVPFAILVCVRGERARERHRAAYAVAITASLITVGCWALLVTFGGPNLIEAGRDLSRLRNW